MPFILFGGDLWLSGTTNEAIIDDRSQDMNGNQEQILLSIWFSKTAFKETWQETSTQGVLSQFCLFWPNPLMGVHVSLAGKICTRAYAEPMHELKYTVISTDVFKFFGGSGSLIIDTFAWFSDLIISCDFLYFWPTDWIWCIKIYRLVRQFIKRCFNSEEKKLVEI